MVGFALWVVVAFGILGRVGLGFILPSLNLGAMRSLHPELIAQGASAISGAIRNAYEAKCSTHCAQLMPRLLVSPLNRECKLE